MRINCIIINHNTSLFIDNQGLLAKKTPQIKVVSNGYNYPLIFTKKH
jgi:hypothetical protein